MAQHSGKCASALPLKGSWGRISVRFVVTRRKRASVLVLAFCRFHLLSGEVFILQRYRTAGDIFDTGGISTNLPVLRVRGSVSSEWVTSYRRVLYGVYTLPRQQFALL